MGGSTKPEQDFLLMKSEHRKRFNKTFLGRLERLLTEGVGEGRAETIMKMVGVSDTKKSRLKISNHFTFFRKDPSFNYDVGVSAYQTCASDVDLFMAEVGKTIAKNIDDGRTEIDLSSIFLFLAQFRNKLKEEDEYYETKMRSLVMSLAGITITSHTSNPFYLNIFPPSMTIDMMDEFKLTSSTKIYSIINYYLEALCFLREKHKTKCHVPTVRIIFPIYENVKKNQWEYLRRVFSLSIYEIRTFTDVVEDLGEETPELVSALEKLKKYSGNTEIETEGILAKLKQIKEECPLFTHSNTDDCEMKNIINKDRAIDGKYLKLLNFEKIYVDRESYIHTCYRNFLEVKVNCDSFEDFIQVEPFIDAASQILMTGVRNALKYKYMLFPNDNYFCLVNLCNVDILSVEFLNKIKEKEKELSSRFNKPFKITLNYSSFAARTIAGHAPARYVRIISDIHADINKDRHYVFDFGNDFVINCGDTSGDFFTTRDWIKTYMIEGVSVTGNHLGYTDLGERAKTCTKEGVPYNLQPKNGQQKMLQITFHSTRTPVLSNDMYEFQNIIFLGNTLYTDFKLFGEKNQIACMAEAGAKVNDFRYCSYYQIEKRKRNKKEKAHKVGNIVPFTPSIHVELFNVCVQWLRNRLEYFKRNNITKPVVIVTHHVPTPYGVMPEFKHDPISAAFASDVRDLVYEYPQIRLWAYGHTHTPHQYIIGNCRFVCNPFGYYNENNFDVKNYGLRIPIDEIDSKIPWTKFLEKEIENGEIKVYNK